MKEDAKNWREQRKAWGTGDSPKAPERFWELHDEGVKIHEKTVGVVDTLRRAERMLKTLRTDDELKRRIEIALKFEPWWRSKQ